MGDRERLAGRGARGTDRSSPWRELWPAAALAGTFLAFLGGMALASSSEAHGRGGWFGGRAHSGHHGRGPHDPERAREHAQFAAAWALQEVDATPEQQARVKEIVGESIEALSALADRHRANREALLALLAQPGIDRAALGALREAELALAEEASVTVTTALADAAEVLSVEQRQRLLEHVERFGH